MTPDDWLSAAVITSLIEYAAFLVVWLKDR